MNNYTTWLDHISSILRRSLKIIRIQWVIVIAMIQLVVEHEYNIDRDFSIYIPFADHFRTEEKQI